VPGRVPAPLIDNEPGPVHGKPVSGFVPVVLGRSPVAIDGETLSSDRAGKSVLCPFSIGLTVFPLRSGLPVFCASAAVAVRMRVPTPISPMRSAMVNLPDSGVPNVEQMKSQVGRRHIDLSQSPLPAPWSRKLPYRLRFMSTRPRQIRFICVPPTAWRSLERGDDPVRRPDTPPLGIRRAT